MNFESIPTLRRVKERNAYSFFDVPTGIKSAISLTRIHQDGIFEYKPKSGMFFRPKTIFSKSFQFFDVNYSVVGEEEKETIFNEYCDLINSYIPGASVKITINNRKINMNDLRKEICLPRVDDELEEFRGEYNQMLSQAISDRNAYIQEKYITVSNDFKNIDEARKFFQTVEKDITIRLNSLNSSCHALEPEERLKILHDFYRNGESASFRLSADVKGYIAPEEYTINKDYIQLAKDRFVRVLFIKDYPNAMKDDFIEKITALKREMMLSIDSVLIPTHEALKDVDKHLMDAETNITKWQRKQNEYYNFSANVPLPLKKESEELKEFMTDISDYDQQEYQTITTIVLVGKSLEDLDNQTIEVKIEGRKFLTEIEILNYDQDAGLNSVLPLGVMKISQDYRTLLTEGLAVFMPFRVQDLLQKDGVFFGQNSETGSIIKIDKASLQNGNSFVIGISGSGKSFISKMELIGYILRGGCDVIIVDPQGEYTKLITSMRGETIKISPSSPTTINLMDLNADYCENGSSPVALKAEFMIAFVEQAARGMLLGPIHRSVITRCTERIYRDYVKSNYQGKVPTLIDFVNELKKQQEAEAQDMAIALELFTSDSFSMFAKETNVDVDNSLISYDISGLGSTLQPTGMLVMLDAVFNRIAANRRAGRRTYIFIDEFHLLAKYNLTADYLERLWRTVRKFGAYCTAITQQVEDVLQNEKTRTMFSNSEVIVMLNQSPDNRKQLSQLLKFPPELLSYVTNAQKGHGLIKFGDTVIPFANDFPKNTELFELMQTDAT